VYEVSVGGTMEAMDATTGAMVWTATVGSGVVDSPAIDANTLYIGSDGGLLSALDATTGAVQCTFQLPSSAPRRPRAASSRPRWSVTTAATDRVLRRHRAVRVREPRREWAVYVSATPTAIASNKWVFDLGATSKRQAQRDLVTAGSRRGFDRATLVVFGSGQPMTLSTRSTPARACGCGASRPQELL